MWLLITAVFLIWLTRCPKERRWQIVKFASLALALTFVVGRVTGWLYYNPRPFVAGGFAPLIPHAADNGFPSDHVLLTGALAAAAFVYNRRLSAILWLLTLAVGAARVYAGVHHWFDIFGAAVITIICVWLAALLWRDKSALDKIKTPSF